MIMARVFIGIGSNIEPDENIRRALHLLAEEFKITAISTFYHTEAWENSEQPDFYNGVVEVETEIPPLKLKQFVLHNIEKALGRVHSLDKYVSRTIDLDLLIYDDELLNTEELVIPDPNIEERPFLAIPLAELAPELELPGTGRYIKDIAAKFVNHKMEPLLSYTENLRKEL